MALVLLGLAAFGAWCIHPVLGIIIIALILVNL
jgi:uncharacterized membrane protein